MDSALPSPSGDDKGKKKSNPLTDLVETEKVYVDLLTGIIRVRRSKAWSVVLSKADHCLAESCGSMVSLEPATTRAGLNVQMYRERIQSQSVVALGED